MNNFLSHSNNPNITAWDCYIKQLLTEVEVKKKKEQKEKPERRDWDMFWFKSCSSISLGNNSFHSGVDKRHLLINCIVNTEVIYHD